jgi:hypothetical protein
VSAPAPPGPAPLAAPAVLRIASDWHLAPRSPPGHAALAAAFLRHAREDGAGVILNGDIFDDLFAGPGRGERAHPAVVAEMEALRSEGRLQRTQGNHDPGVEQVQLLVEWPGLGRVLVAHGHLADPIQRSWIGKLGNGISARFGRLGLVRGAAALAEATARAAARGHMERSFRTRCLSLVERERAVLGVFGHLHAPHLVPGDRYANAGALSGERLSFLELGPGGPHLRAMGGVDPSPPGRFGE